MAIVYMHLRKDTNEPFYVGVGKSKKRAFSKASRNKHWHNIANKIGYIVEIVCHDLTYEQALSREVELIAEIGRSDLRKGPLVNYNDGGLGGSNPSEETRRKRSESHKGKIVTKETREKISAYHKGKTLSEEVRQKISNTLKGNKNMKTNFTRTTCPVCGKEGQTSAMMRWHFNNCGIASKIASDKMKTRVPISAETRQKMSDAHKGRTRSAESIQKQVKAREGIKVSQKTIQKIIQTKKQNGTLNMKRSSESIQKGLRTRKERGYDKLSEEHKQKISDKLKGKKKQKIECPYCHKIGGIAGMKRYHFNNCKLQHEASQED